MKISELAVRYPQLTIVLFLMAVALGLSALGSIPLAEDPTFPISTYAVVAVYPGATPAGPGTAGGGSKLETRFNELDDLKSLKTTIEDGVAVITVEFDASTDPARQVRRSRARGERAASRPARPTSTGSRCRSSTCPT